MGENLSIGQPAWRILHVPSRPLHLSLRVETQRKTERKVPDSGKVKRCGIREQAGMEGEGDPRGSTGFGSK